MRATSSTVGWFAVLALGSACSATPERAPAPDPETTRTSQALSLGTELEVTTQSGGEVWLASVVPTTSGWGLFWLRSEPPQTNLARLYYAHVDFAGNVDGAPQQIFSVKRLEWRNRYYNVAWHDDHYGLFTADGPTLDYQSVSLSGVVGTKKTVGPPLLADTQWDTEDDSDIAVYPAGFAMAIEGECAGHSCSYAFRLDPQGNAIGSIKNLVDPYSHEFFPRIEYDGSGFTVLSVQDINISSGGVATRYLTSSWQLQPRKKVVPSKQYMWDERTALAYNGQNYAALWSENPQRSHSQPWQVHFATFQRTASVATPISDVPLSQEPNYPGFRWCSRVHAWGSDWLVQYLHGQANQAPDAVFQVVGNDGTVKSTLTPFSVTTDALGSSTHPSQPGKLGVLRADQSGGSYRIVFQLISGTPAAPPPPVSIGGKIRYHATGAPLAGVHVALSDSTSGAAQADAVTDSSGSYLFAGLQAGKSWRLDASYSAAAPGAVSALDATWVLQAVAGTRTLTSLQRLAADATGDGTLSALDATRILQFVAGSIEKLPAVQTCGTQWLFASTASSGAIAPQLGNGSCQAGARSLPGVTSDVSDADFDAVLLGDVTGNFSP